MNPLNCFDKDQTTAAKDHPDPLAPCHAGGSSSARWARDGQVHATVRTPVAQQPAEHPRPWVTSAGEISSSTRHLGHPVQQRHGDAQSRSARAQCCTASQRQHLNLKQPPYLRHCTHRLHPQLLQINANTWIYFFFLMARGTLRSSKLSVCIKQAVELHPATVMRSLITCAGQPSCHSLQRQLTKDKTPLSELNQLEFAS